MDSGLRPFPWSPKLGSGPFSGWKPMKKVINILESTLATCSVLQASFQQDAQETKHGTFFFHHVMGVYLLVSCQLQAECLPNQPVLADCQIPKQQLDLEKKQKTSKKTYGRYGQTTRSYHLISAIMILRMSGSVSHAHRQTSNTQTDNSELQPLVLLILEVRGKYNEHQWTRTLQHSWKAHNHPYLTQCIPCRLTWMVRIQNNWNFIACDRTKRREGSTGSNFSRLSISSVNSLKNCLTRLETVYCKLCRKSTINS